MEPEDHKPMFPLYDKRHEHDACGVGAIAHIKGVKSHQLLEDALQMVQNLAHRGAVGADPRTGDGAGITLQIPDAFFREVVDFPLPEPPGYAVGNVFLPRSEATADAAKGIIEEVLQRLGLELLGYRAPPVNPTCLGDGSKETEPVTEQVFVGRGQVGMDSFRLALYRARRVMEKIATATLDLKASDCFYFCSLSPDTLVYKGMFLADQLGDYYLDLKDERVTTAIALVHQRFSTNTFPSWPLAHPFRYLCHNGEVNTIQGNINQMRAREADLFHEALGEEGTKDLFPLIPPGTSDSAALDGALEVLLHSGRSLPHVLAMMIPEAWGSRKHMNEDKKDFYIYHANLMEPWDGPATIAAFDGRHFCAMLDRNGLRPARYLITADDRLIFGSEAGMLPIDERMILKKSRLWPGKMIALDFQTREVLEDDDAKKPLITKRPYGRWLANNLVSLEDLPDPVKPPKMLREPLECLHRLYGYSEEVLREILRPMTTLGQEPVGAMGNDTPLAVLSKKPRPLYDYFRQKFAQVTNPAIDPIREEIVMGTSLYFGSTWNMFDEGPQYCHQVLLTQPFLTNHELETLAQTRTQFLRGAIVSMTMPYSEQADALEKGLKLMCQRAEEKISLGYNAIILSDRKASKEDMPLPALLAVGALHQHLIRKGIRGNLGLIVETADAFSTHHMACLLGFGATAINPYLAFDTIREMRVMDLLPGRDPNEDDFEDPLAYYDRNYMKALNKGLKKIMSKMGISTLRSYRGAQIFEALGIGDQIIDDCFTGTYSPLSGIGYDEVHKDMLTRHEKAFLPWPNPHRARDFGGELSWRPLGELHLLTPEAIALVQQAVREDDYSLFKRYSQLVDDQAGRLVTLRGLLSFKETRPSLPLSEVEPVSEIVKRFCTGAMSLGSISTEAHETLAIAMNRLGGKSNTGEGGEDERRFVKKDPEEDKRSKIKQVASGRFGVTPVYLVHADEIQIKVAQGAKPGEGGQLPGHKVSPYIASLRHSTPGVSLISPPPHHDIYSIEDLAQLIFDLKNINPAADISVKLVAESGVGTVAAGVAKAHAEGVVIAGHDGGTGASPISSIHSAGLPWELGLSETHQTLLKNKLRARIRVQTDGQLKTGRDVVIATLLGAEEYGFATMALVAEGCIMMRKCHLDTCPVGIATQNPKLRKHYRGTPEDVVRLMTFIATEVRETMARLGFRTIKEMVGHGEMLTVREDIQHDKSKLLQLERLFTKSPSGECQGQTIPQDHGLSAIMDQELLQWAQPVLDGGEGPLETYRPITTKDRATATMLCGEIARRFGRKGLPDDSLVIHFEGSAGQSFGAFLMPGVHLTLTGEANDYAGKGMHGGIIAIKPPSDTPRTAKDQTIAGNTLLYGATGGAMFLAGRAGERFGVRNSGAKAVVEGLGDHGLEYMTGGVVVVLGPTGRNFAAGMSGGVGYVRDEDRLFSRRCNPGMVDIESLDPSEEEEVKALIEAHLKHTGSVEAARILSDWEQQVALFVKVMPREYRKVLTQLGRKKRQAGG